MLYRSLFLLFLFSAPLAFSQQQKIKAYVDNKTFYSAEAGSFVDVDIQFVGYTMKYKGAEGGLQASVAIFTQVTNEAGDTVFTDGYRLNSPIMRDSVIEDFFDVVRVPLNPGKYNINISLQDLIAENEPIAGKLEVTVPDYRTKLGISDILVAEAAYVSDPNGTPSVFSKSGYDILPRISNFYPQDLTMIPYYVEIYNTGALPDSTFILVQKVINTENNLALPDMDRNIVLKKGAITPVLRKLDITKLPSGSFKLELAVYDKLNNRHGEVRSYYFDRDNQVEQLETGVVMLDPGFQQSLTDDSLEFYLASLVPISKSGDAKTIYATIKTHNKDQMRKLIQAYWQASQGTAATDQWLKYKQTVLLVEKNYGSKLYPGYVTDRGRVYLQYGAPNTINTRESSPEEYPYEIWHYYKIRQFSNKRFVFYNPDLVGNNYRLLHSDLIGEPQNYRWQYDLIKRNANNANIDDPTGGNSNTFGNNAGTLYKQE